MDKNKAIEKLTRMLLVPIDDLRFTGHQVQLFYKQKSIGKIYFGHIPTFGQNVIKYFTPEEVLNDLDWEAIYEHNAKAIDASIITQLGYVPKISSATWRKLYLHKGSETKNSRMLL